MSAHRAALTGVSDLRPRLPPQPPTSGGGRNGVSTEVIARAAVLATLVGSLGVLGQIWVTRRQLGLQEAATYRDQAQPWRALAIDWRLLVVVGLGPHTARQVGLDAQACRRYEGVLEEYRTARLEWHDALLRLDQEGQEGVWPDEAAERMQHARAALEPYHSAVRAVLVHLAQLCDLVLRRRLSARSLHDAVGHDLLRDEGALRRVARLPYDLGGCPGPEHHEAEGWRGLTLDEVSGRIGWASALSESAGPAARVHLLLDLLVLHADAAGEQIWVGDGTAAQLVAAPANVARRWHTARRVSRVSAWRLCWSASGVVSGWALFGSHSAARRAAWRLVRPVRCAVLALRASVSEGDDRHVYLDPPPLVDRHPVSPAPGEVEGDGGTRQVESAAPRGAVRSAQGAI